ncbi:MAG: class I SAM-dependent methyltransferase family protein [Thermoplasmata archaeon]|nr:class I SAM-dependent methyltransferase family protein [Thermoplasmata archaeon]
MKSLCLIVPKKDAEDVRKKLIADGLFRTELKIEKENDYLLIPILKSIDLGFKIEEREFVKREKPIGDYKELLDIPPELEELLPSSMDIIGDIAIIRLPDELSDFAEKIGNAIAKSHRAKTVAIDRGVEGSLRLRDLELVVGEETHTVHREYGMRFELDVREVYFSPRLTAERRRISNLVKDGETVIDMFCGVGPFSIMIAKYRSPERVYAIDINPKAMEYLNRNISKNRVERIKPILGDAKEVVGSIEKADRIIMNLPLDSFRYLDAAFSAVKDGGTVHYYEVLNRDVMHERLDQLKEKASGMGRKLDANVREVKSYSSTKSYFAFDLEIRG